MELKIYTDRLKDEQAEKFAGQVSADFLEIQEEDLTFSSPVSIRGEAYLASDHLIVRFHIETTATLPCSICNSTVEVPICLPDFMHTEPVSEIKSCVFDLVPLLREDILLQVPQFTECNGGHCPERDTMKKFTKAPSSEKEDAYFPFANLDLDTK